MEKLAIDDRVYPVGRPVPYLKKGGTSMSSSEISNVER
jgi:hypothetical protein